MSDVLGALDDERVATFGEKTMSDDALLSGSDGSDSGSSDSTD